MPLRPNPFADDGSIASRIVYWRPGTVITGTIATRRPEQISDAGISDYLQRSLFPRVPRSHGIKHLLGGAELELDRRGSAEDRGRRRRQFNCLPVPWARATGHDEPDRTNWRSMVKSPIYVERHWRGVDPDSVQRSGCGFRARRDQPIARRACGSRSLYESISCRCFPWDWAVSDARRSAYGKRGGSGGPRRRNLQRRHGVRPGRRRPGGDIGR